MTDECDHCHLWLTLTERSQAQKTQNWFPQTHFTNIMSIIYSRSLPPVCNEVFSKSCNILPYHLILHHFNLAQQYTYQLNFQNVF